MEWGWVLPPPGRKNSLVLGRIKVAPTIMLFVLSFLLVFSSYRLENQTVNAQSTGGDVNVLYAGSLIPITETKIGPAFSHLGYNYRGEGLTVPTNAMGIKTDVLILAE
jgi:hypothetical protein